MKDYNTPDFTIIKFDSVDIIVSSTETPIPTTEKEWSDNY